MAHIGRRYATAVVIAGLVACAESPTAREEAGSEDPGPVSDDPQPSPSQTTSAPAALVDRLRADLSRRTGVAAADILIVSARAMQWNDGSLGCPQPGMAYFQMIVDGYWVILEAQGRQYDYRTGQGGAFMLCERPPATPGGRPREP